MRENYRDHSEIIEHNRKQIAVKQYKSDPKKIVAHNGVRDYLEEKKMERIKNDPFFYID